ncbi:MAG TPA: hypothetical protein VIL99_07365 [Ignavibacteria bacterium]
MSDIKKIFKYLELLNTPEEKLEYLNQKKDEILNNQKTKFSIKSPLNVMRLLGNAILALFSDSKSDSRSVFKSVSKSVFKSVYSIYKHKIAGSVSPISGYINIPNSKYRLMQRYIARLNTIISSIKKDKINLNNRKFQKVKVRTKEDYIVWSGSRIILENLLSGLVYKKCILDYNQNEINIIINDHFYIEGYTELNNNEARYMRWARSYPQLLYLFESLYNKKFSEKKSETQVLETKFWDKRHAIVSEHFINFKGEPISNDILARSELQYKKGEYDTKPNYYELIDIIIEEAFEESI